MGRSCIKINIEDLSAIEIHDKLSIVRTLVKHLIDGNNSEAYECFSISISHDIVWTAQVNELARSHKFYYIYITELTEYQQHILTDLGYELIGVHGLYKKDWTKLNLN